MIKREVRSLKKVNVLNVVTGGVQDISARAGLCIILKGSYLRKTQMKRNSLQNLVWKKRDTEGEVTLNSISCHLPPSTIKLTATSKVKRFRY